MPAQRPRRLGRPPASNSVETRERILTAARETFAQLGWSQTTNKDLAEKAGVTSGALYHYFDSKLDIYLAAYDDVQESIEVRFREAMATVDTFVGQFEAVLEAAHAMNAADPSLARFLGSCRVDIARHGELRGPIEQRANVAAVINTQLVDQAVATGEIGAQQQEELSAFLRTVLVGLTDAVSENLHLHRAAIDAVRAVVSGTFLRPPRRHRPARTAQGRPRKAIPPVPARPFLDAS